MSRASQTPSVPRVGYESLELGGEHEAIVVENLTRTQIVQYAGASGDFNPIHHDEEFARKAGYPSVFAHGMLTMGLMGRMLTDWLGDGVLRSFGVRFRAQVWPGDTLTARARVTSIEKQAGGETARVELELVTVNQTGDPVASGSAAAVLPACV